MYGYPEHTKESIKEKLSTDQRWIEKALELLYYNQTRDEIENGETKEQNGKGFNYEDAPILSLYADIILGGKSLTEAQLEGAKKRLPKYWKQILSYILSLPKGSNFIND